MGENSGIQWTDHTFNPWIGCTKVSPGCLHCYAETLMDTRWGRVKWGAGQPRSRTKPGTWDNPRKWNKAIALYNQNRDCKEVRPRVFCASLADWLDDEVPIEWLADLLQLIRETPNLDWLLLTKRPANFRQRVDAAAASINMRDQGTAGMCSQWIDDGIPPANVWIGTTVEDQTRADQRIPALLAIPAKVRFLSCEPLLGPVDLLAAMGRLSSSQIPGGPDRGWLGIHWIIAGGESGDGARPMEIEWARSLKDQAAAAGVPFFMKQLGGPRDHRSELSDFPADLRVRQFPTTTTTP